MLSIHRNSLPDVVAQLLKQLQAFNSTNIPQADFQSKDLHGRDLDRVS